MRKLLVGMLILIILTGCVSGQSPNEETQSTGGTQSAQACLQGPFMRNLEEYEEYVASFTDQADFIHYDMIKALGRFEGFSDEGIHWGYDEILPDQEGRRNGKCEVYSYGLRTKEGKKIVFLVYPATSVDVGEISMKTTFSSPQDLRMNKNADGWYMNENIMYCYDEGKLKELRWRQDALGFRVSILGGADFSEYQSEWDVLNRLFNAETAQSAVEEFSANVAVVRQDKAAKTE